ncbi:ASCH domain-containing protein [Zafaria sp. J156]|nr:ASCH domain-containing protein [Zafaria sp. J156]MEE1619774.1 ASCH domain-containing protein [Zafaria sp. J156]
MWASYLASGAEMHGERDMPSVEYFGDSPALADELLGLVLSGRKRATATLAAEFGADGEPLPRIGGHWIACDGGGAPRVVLRTTELRLGPITSADAAFARDEAEDDGSLPVWLDGHRRYWSRVAAARGLEFTDATEIVFERFDVVWSEAP